MCFYPQIIIHETLQKSKHIPYYIKEVEEKHMSKLENYYGKFCEDKRLLSRHGQVEYTTSMKYIHKYLKSEDRINLISFVT